MNTCLVSAIIFAAVLTTTCLVNIPLGRLRSRQRKFSTKWFLYIHLSIPLIHLMRTREGFGYWAIPLLIAAGVVGQILGGNVRERRAVGQTGETRDK
ncbi:MAG: hypothetical protein Q7T82_13965 [Armatimonadota bacterium]|nr:hypothetical protein [Armatimonadota bacterium]